MKKNIVIGVLVVIILILGGSLFYLNMNKDKVMDKCKVEEKVESEPEDLLSTEEALALAKEKYLYARDGLYECGYTQIKTEENKKYVYSDTGITAAGDTGDYLKIININEIKNNFTDHGFSDWKYFMDIRKDGNDFYINYFDGCGGDSTYGYDKYEITTSKITKDMIVYDITEKFYKEKLDEISDQIDENANFKTRFVLIKENNTWKIDEYTNYTFKYILE